MKKYIAVFFLFFIFGFVFVKSINAACGVMVTGSCDGSNFPDSSVLCPATNSICCDSLQECPLPPGAEQGEIGGPCLVGVNPPCSNGAHCTNGICVAQGGVGPENTYGCQWDSTHNECYGVNTGGCSSGYTTSNGCSGLSQTNCPGATPECVLSSSSSGGGNNNSNSTSGGTGQLHCQDRPNTINTAIGCIDFSDTNALAKFFLGWALGISGGVALLLVGLASFRIATSQGDPKRLQGGQELLLSALGGLLLIVLSVFLLRFIGVDLLGLF